MADGDNRLVHRQTATLQTTTATQTLGASIDIPNTTAAGVVVATVHALRTETTPSLFSERKAAAFRKASGSYTVNNPTTVFTNDPGTTGYSTTIETENLSTGVIECNVTGATSQTVRWFVTVEVYAGDATFA